MFYDIFSLLREQKKIVRLIGTIKVAQVQFVIKNTEIYYLLG